MSTFEPSPAMPPARGKSPAPFALRRLSCTVLIQDISCAVALEPCAWNMLSQKLLSIQNPTRSESMSIVMDYDSTANLRPKAKPCVSPSIPSIAQSRPLTFLEICGKSVGGSLGIGECRA